jgi:GMP synthase (glutamine-hydrolysing)
MSDSPKGIILSGGPSSIYNGSSPKASLEFLRLGVPVLGICYGFQWMVHALGGDVKRAERHEYGRSEMEVLDRRGLFKDMPHNLWVWMSHGDRIEHLPSGFTVLGSTRNAPFASAANLEKRLFGVQFHPEVVHTERGREVLRNFVFDICGSESNWRMSSFIDEACRMIRDRVGEKGVICALSGGVDSSTLSVLVHRAVGDQLTCIFVDNGLLRKGEVERVLETFRGHFQINVDLVEAGPMFLKRLKGVVDPEEKRRIVGETFIEVFEEEARRIGDVKFLAQGTLYPDVIESVSVKGPSATIKTHHNVGGLPEELGLELIEPFRELFKDEVRAVAAELGVPDDLIWQHPFPGPGLAVRIIGEVTSQRLEVLREADFIATEEMKRAGLYRAIWQGFCVFLPVKTVGVMGDERTYENVICLRCVESQDGMTADWFSMPREVLERISNRIVNEVPGVNRVVYDVTSKPPGTIEWE